MPAASTPRPAPRLLVLWDLDHTLIETRGVGHAIYQRAFPVATGKPLATLASISGRTELDIMAESLRLNGIEPTEEMVTRLARALIRGYQDAREELRTVGRALPGVRDTLAGAYGDDDPERPKLVPIAQRRATERTGVMFDHDATVLIGDTPQDVDTGLASGVRVIGVATGKTSIQELRDIGAHHVENDLAECHVILNRLIAG